MESVCSEMNIPNLVAYWKPEPYNQRSYNRPHNMTINLYPESNLLSNAVSDLIIDYSWKSFAILYDDNDGITL